MVSYQEGATESCYSSHQAHTERGSWTRDSFTSAEKMIQLQGHEELCRQSVWLPKDGSIPASPSLSQQADTGRDTQGLGRVPTGEENVAASPSRLYVCHAIQVLQENLHTKLWFSQPLYLLIPPPHTHKRIERKENKTTVINGTGGERETLKLNLCTQVLNK